MLRRHQGLVSSLNLIMRLRFVAPVVFLSLAFNMGAHSKAPNILFFFADDQRNDTLGVEGHPIVKTPTIDRLANEGVRFTNSFVSHSICWVSRTSILCGLTARSFGEPASPDAARPDAVNTLYTDLLRGAGYRTGFYGKWHAKMSRDYRPEDHFDEYERIFRNPFFHKQPDGSLRHTTELIADGGIRFLKSQSKDQPFQLNLWFNVAHAEDRDRRPGNGHFPCPKAVDGMYEDQIMPEPRLNDPAIYEKHPDFLKQGVNRERFFWRWDTPEKYQANMRAYFRMLSGLDQAIARVLKVLKEEGLSDNTIVVYSADNGYYMGDRGFAGKWTHYEQSIRVPLIIYDPRYKGGKVIPLFALNLDLPVTFLTWAGVTVPDRYQGLDLSGFVNGQTPKSWRTVTFHEHVGLRPNHSWEGIRDRRFKYARYFDQEGPYEFLHDLRNDPDELVNLAENPAYKMELEAMRLRTDITVDAYGGPLRSIASSKR
ncbi:MAG: acetylglucosamine-6-sulfatase [Opitutaceae bacterium]|nr:acetylglucosamine-6-sulfatase [Opitutaceae bacterium]